MNLEEIYKKLGLKASYQFQLLASKEQFIRVLKSHVSDDNGSSLDMFSSGSIHYKGWVNNNGFYLRKRRGLMTRNRHYCKAVGSFREENNNLLIDVEYRNISPPIIIAYAILILFNAVAVFGIISGIVQLDFSLAGSFVGNLFTTLLLAGVVAFIIHQVSMSTITKVRYEMEKNFQEYIYNKV